MQLTLLSTWNLLFSLLLATIQWCKYNFTCDFICRPKLTYDWLLTEVQHLLKTVMVAVFQLAAVFTLWSNCVDHIYNNWSQLHSNVLNNLVNIKLYLNDNDTLKQLGLMKLEGRRIRSNLAETLKIVNGKYDINPELFFQLDAAGTRGHHLKLFKKRFRLDVRKNVFFNRFVGNWNMLPASCVNCRTINTQETPLWTGIRSCKA